MGHSRKSVRRTDRLPIAPAAIRVRPTSTPVGTTGVLPSGRRALPPSGVTDFLDRDKIHQKRRPKRIILKRDRQNFPAMPPNFIPKAIPSFSMKKIWNQFPITLKCSPICIFVLTRIFMIWSMTTSRTPRANSLVPFETFTSFPVCGYFLNQFLPLDASISFALTVSVAWGTRRSLSLGISSPVTRQTP